MAIELLYTGSCVRGVQADTTILLRFFSSISLIISFCPLSVHKNGWVLATITSS
ncbi:MAG: hypothetical protein ACTSRH_10790 [Promethearchaeota archaeon]